MGCGCTARVPEPVTTTPVIPIEPDVVNAREDSSGSLDLRQQLPSSGATIRSESNAVMSDGSSAESVQHKCINPNLVKETCDSPRRAFGRNWRGVNRPQPEHDAEAVSVERFEEPPQNVAVQTNEEEMWSWFVDLDNLAVEDVDDVDEPLNAPCISTSVAPVRFNGAAFNHDDVAESQEKQPLNSEVTMTRSDDSRKESFPQTSLERKRRLSPDHRLGYGNSRHLRNRPHPEVVIDDDEPILLPRRAAGRNWRGLGSRRDLCGAEDQPSAESNEREEGQSSYAREPSSLEKSVTSAQVAPDGLHWTRASKPWMSPRRRCSSDGVTSTLEVHRV
eukprot:TRINITY_DN64625_c0_g1_i1.p1 TRINITY_DN64625_c0_g1~~TRINITY_DN64625_c0_g1_i1.p1  ORF type:complete len:333 (-),score=37.74 TRINITY_DN64625_c0_g1_i1:82-1080(-)